MIRLLTFLYITFFILHQSLSIELKLTLLSVYDTSKVGRAVAVNNSTAFYIDENELLHILNVSNSSYPVFVSSKDVKSVANNVVFYDNFLYIADYLKNLNVYDVTNVSYPAKAFNYDSAGRVYDVFLVNYLAYLASGYYGLEIIDVSNHSIGIKIGGYNTPGLAKGLTVSNNIVYLADLNGLVIINATIPSNPTLLSHYQITENAERVSFMNDIVYLASGYEGLYIIDVSNHSYPSMLGIYSLQNSSSYAEGVTLFDHYPNWAIVFFSEGLHIIDISNPSNPLHIVSYFSSVEIVHVVGNILYIAGEGLKIVEVVLPILPIDSSSTNSLPIPLIIILFWLVFLTLLFIILKSRLLWWYRLRYDTSYLFFTVFGVANFISDILFIIYLFSSFDKYFLLAILSSSIFILSIIFNYIRIRKWWFRKIRHCREKSTTDLILEYLKKNNTAFYIIMYLAILINPHLLFILRSGLVFATFDLKLPINERDMSISNLCMLHDIYSVIPQCSLLILSIEESLFNWSTFYSIIFIIKVCIFLLLLIRGIIFIILGDEIRAIPGYKMQHSIMYVREPSHISIYSSSYIS